MNRNGRGVVGEYIADRSAPSIVSDIAVSVLKFII